MQEQSGRGVLQWESFTREHLSSLGASPEFVRRYMSGKLSWENLTTQQQEILAKAETLTEADCLAG
jgi:hypothetical protein